MPSSPPRINSFLVGDYEQAPIDFQKYEASTFRPSLITKRETPIFSAMGCGLAAVFTLTGLSPSHLIKKCVENKIEFFKGTSADELIGLLRDAGYTALPITLRDVCPRKRYIEEKVNDKHVLLVAQWVARSELSWFVLWDNLEIHSFGIRVSCRRSFVNNPVDQCILVHHPSWSVDLPSLPDEGTRYAAAFRNDIPGRFVALSERITRLRMKMLEMAPPQSEKDKLEGEISRLDEELISMRKDYEDEQTLERWKKA
jgi:hypothetical protein